MLKSITARLACLYSALTIGVLIMISLVLYFSLMTMAEKSSKQFLNDELAYFQTIIRNQQGDLTPLQHEINWIPEPVEIAERNKASWILPYDYIRILDGKTLLQKTPDMQNILPREIFPEILNGQKSKVSEYHSTLGRRFFLISGQVGFANHQHRTIQIGLDVTAASQVFQYYRHLLVLIILLLSLVIGASAGFIAKKALKPLHTLSNRARNIRVHDLSQRFLPHNWPKELKELIASLNEMLARIDQSYQRLNRFSAELAHELRTPLNNLMGEAQVTLSRSRENKEYHALITSSLEEYQRINQLIEQMLLLATLENPEPPPSIERIDAKESIEAVLQYFEFLIEEKKLSIHCNVSGTLKANKILWQRVVTNLIDNAIKYSRPAGTLCLRGEMKNKRFSFTLQDSGIGIKEFDLPLLCERFYRVGQNNQPGFGLGLSITESIVKCHKGEIEINSEYGVGTKVIVLI